MEDNELIYSMTKEDLKATIRQCVRKELAGKYKKDVEEKLLSVDEVRHLFQPAISRMTINRWEKSGYIKAYQVLSKKFYKHSEVKAALESRKTKRVAVPADY